MIRTVPARLSPPRRAALALVAVMALRASACAETLTLETCLRETAANSPTIIAQQWEIQRATGARLTLRARALPTLQIGGFVGYQGKQSDEDLQIPVRQPDGTTTKVTVISQRPAQEILLGTENLSQPIFDAAIPASWRRGNVGVLAAQQNYYTVAAAQLYRARTEFVRALYEQERGVVLHQADDLLAADVRAVEALVTAGLRGRQDLLAAQVRRANFNPSLVEAAGSYRSTLATLLQTMGRQLGTGPGGADRLTGITLRGSLDEKSFAFDATEAGREALTQRPDIRALREQVRSNQEDARITRGGYYPRVRVYVAGELLPESFVRSSRPDAIRSSDQVQTTEVRPGVACDWAIIDTGLVRGEARRIDAAVAGLAIALRQLERDIPGELAGLRATVQQGVGSLDALRGNVLTAQDTLNLVNAGVAQGVNSQLDFLDAETGLVNTQFGILDAKLALTLAHAEFDRITGRYLRFVTDDNPTPASAATRSRAK